MNPPQVLIERTAIVALCDRENEHHDAVTRAYLALLDEFEDDKLLLVAVSDHLIPWRDWTNVRRRGPLAVVDTLHVGFQHRRAARRMTEVADFDHALTLVMCQRHKVARILTVNPNFAKYDDVVVEVPVQVVGQGDDVRG